MCERHLVDPDGKYDFAGPSRVELVALQLLGILPRPCLERTRDVIQLEVQSEPGVILLVTADHVEFRLPTIEWTRGAYAPAPSSRFWQRIRVQSFGQFNLYRMIAGLDQKRRVCAAEIAWSKHAPR